MINNVKIFMIDLYHKEMLTKTLQFVKESIVKWKLKMMKIERIKMKIQFIKIYLQIIFQKNKK